MPKYQARITPHIPRGTEANTNTTTPSGYTPGGGSDDVLWAWNETDVSEFGPSIELRTTALAELNITTDTISYLAAISAGGSAVSGSGPRARFQTTMTGANGGAFQYPILSGGSPLVVPDRFVWRMRIAKATNMKVGIILWNGNTGDPYGVGLANLHEGNTATELVELRGLSPAGADDPYVLPATTIGGVNTNDFSSTSSNGALVEYTWMVTQGTVTTYPTGAAWLDFLGASFSSATRIANVVGASFGMIPGTPVAAWTNKQINRLSLLFVTVNPTGTSSNVEIAEMQVLKHPMDRT